jgi:cold-inducible RNA-binding protein
VATKLYVGNLAYGVSNTELENLFTPHGTVQSAQVIMDRDTGRSKGFGFVEMSSGTEATSAINALNGKEQDGRALTVNEARPREDRGGSRSGGGSGGGSGAGGGSRRY